MGDVLPVLLAEASATDLEHPAYTFVCWLYCSTYDVIWSNAAYVIALLGIVATILALQRKTGKQVRTYRIRRLSSGCGTANLPT